MGAHAAAVSRDSALAPGDATWLGSVSRSSLTLLSCEGGDLESTPPPRVILGARSFEDHYSREMRP